VELANRAIDIQARRQQMSNTGPKVNKILTYNVVVDHERLFWVDPSGADGFENGPVTVLLLFPQYKVNNAIWNKTPVPCAGSGNYTCDITCFRKQQRPFDGSESVFTRRLL
jgi:hypothetical protein